MAEFFLNFLHLAFSHDLFPFFPFVARHTPLALHSSLFSWLQGRGAVGAREGDVVGSSAAVGLRVGALDGLTEKGAREGDTEGVGVTSLGQVNSALCVSLSSLVCIPQQKVDVLLVQTILGTSGTFISSTKILKFHEFTLVDFDLSAATTRGLENSAFVPQTLILHSDPFVR